MPSRREVLYAALLMAFVWASLFGHWLPIAIQNVLFVVVLILGFALIVTGWRHWIKTRNSENAPLWKRRVGLLGLVANTTALAAPIGSLLYMMFYPFLGARVGLPMVDAQSLILIVLVLSVCGLVAGIFAPARIRLATAVGALVIGSMVLSIPIGIL